MSSKVLTARDVMSHFAGNHRVAQIGPRTLLLLAWIVEAQPIDGPVHLSTEELLRVIGGEYRSDLKRTRDRAIAAGWLSWTTRTEGGKERSYYRVIVPDPARSSSATPNSDGRSVAATPPDHTRPTSGGFRQAKFARRDP